MKTRTNQPIYKDNGTLLTDEDLGGGGGGHAYIIEINAQERYIYFTSNDSITDITTFKNDLTRIGATSFNQRIGVVTMRGLFPQSGIVYGVSTGFYLNNDVIKRADATLKIVTNTEVTSGYAINVTNVQTTISSISSITKLF